MVYIQFRTIDNLGYLDLFKFMQIRCKVLLVRNTFIAKQHSDYEFVHIYMYAATLMRFSLSHFLSK
jgi:hypothetical protein